MNPLSHAGSGWAEPVCDTHSHVYPDNPEHEATLDGYLRAAHSVGVGRHVIVHSKAYRHDSRCTLDTVARLGLDRARAVVWEEPGWHDDDRQRLHLAGVRGVRHLYANGASPDLGVLKESAARVASWGWHLLVQADGAALQEDDLVALCQLPCPVVIDHIGRFAPDVAARSGSFGALVRFVREGGWVKLAAPYYGTPDGSADFRPLQARVHALLDAGCSRIIWGMNWPHVNLPANQRPNEAAMLESLLGVIRSEPEARAVLAANAARLYGFGEVTATQT